MKNITPYFIFNGQRFEIKKTRYLLAEYDKLAKENRLDNTEKASAVKAQTMVSDLKKYAEKVKELEDIYFETFDDEDERKYLKAKALYEKQFEEFTKLELETESLDKLQKAGIDILEKIAIKSLAEQYFNFDESKAKALWENYVDELGNDNTVEWLTYMSQCLFEDEREGDDFLSQMRKNAETKANNRKKGLKN